MPVPARTHHPPLIDLPAVAHRLGVNDRHIRRLVAEHRIPYLKVGRLLRFDPDEIETGLDQNRRAHHAAVIRTDLAAR